MLVGAGSKLAALRDGKLESVAVPSLGGRGLHGLLAQPGRAFARV